MLIVVNFGDVYIETYKIMFGYYNNVLKLLLHQVNS